MKLESIQVGQPRTYGTPDAEDPEERPWTSAIRKEPVEGPVWAGPEGLTGDHQFDRQGHGGPERALLMYSAEHYPRWRAEGGRRDVGPGGVGENLTGSGGSREKGCLRQGFPFGGGRG